MPRATTTEIRAFSTCTEPPNGSELELYDDDVLVVWDVAGEHDEDDDAEPLLNLDDATEERCRAAFAEMVASIRWCKSRRA